MCLNTDTLKITIWSSGLPSKHLSCLILQKNSQQGIKTVPRELTPPFTALLCSLRQLTLSRGVPCMGCPGIKAGKAHSSGDLICMAYDVPPNLQKASSLASHTPLPPRSGGIIILFLRLKILFVLYCNLCNQIVIKNDRYLRLESKFLHGSRGETGYEFFKAR